MTFPPPKMPQGQQALHRVAMFSFPAALQEGSTCDSGEYTQTHCFQEWSWSASASLRNSVSFKQSIAEINTQLPRKVEGFCFSAVGFIFLTVNHTIIFAIPALQSNRCSGPDLLPSRSELSWKTGHKKGAKKCMFHLIWPVCNLHLKGKLGKARSGRNSWQQGLFAAKKPKEGLYGNKASGSCMNFKSHHYV